MRLRQLCRVSSIYPISYQRFATGMRLALQALRTIVKDRVSRAENDILRYLLVHQDARDTIEGIEQWWLPQPRDYGIAEIAAALLRLEHRGLISMWKSVSAQPLYSLRSGDHAQSLEDYLGSLE
jgi:hypothetical protein